MAHFYYLHTNGELIHKNIRPDEGDFVRRIWELDTTYRGSAWLLLIEAAALGANQSRINELVKKWEITDEDAATFAETFGFTLGVDGDAVFAHETAGFIDIQESQIGFGNTYFNALVDYAKQGLIYIRAQA